MATKVANGLDLQSQRIVSLADPSSAQDAATKAYVDAFAAGLAWKREVVAATTANGTLASAYENGDVIDGITLVTGDRILLKNQTTQTENGIYTVNASGAPTRAVDANSTAGLQSATVLVVKGTVGKDTAWTQTTDDVTVGSSNVVFVQFGAGTTYTAGNGLQLISTAFSILVDGTSLTTSGSGVKIASAVADAGLLETSAGSGLIKVGAGTGILVNANDVAVDYSVVATRYSAAIPGSTTSWVVTHGLTNMNVQVSLYETSGGAEWIPDVTARTATTVTLSFPSAPGAGSLTVVVE